jgi:hypothetical protein
MNAPINIIRTVIKLFGIGKSDGTNDARYSSYRKYATIAPINPEILYRRVLLIDIPNA